MVYFDKWLKKQMEAQELTAHDVAKITGYSYPCVLQWAKGYQTPRYDAFTDVIYALGYEIQIVRKGCCNECAFKN